MSRVRSSVAQQAELSVSDLGDLTVAAAATAHPATNSAATTSAATTSAAPDTAELVRSLTARGEALLHGHGAGEAVECLRIASMLASPDDERPARLLNRAIREVVPRWHFAMMNDHERNAAYEEAIIATVR